MRTCAVHDEAAEPLAARGLHEIEPVIDEEGLFRRDADGLECGREHARVGLGAALLKGVETIEQADLLREWGCDEIQGYLISQGLPPAEFERFLERDKSD